MDGAGLCFVKQVSESIQSSAVSCAGVKVFKYSYSFSRETDSIRWLYSRAAYRLVLASSYRKGFSIESRNFPKRKQTKMGGTREAEKRCSGSPFVFLSYSPESIRCVLFSSCWVLWAVFLLFINNWRDIKYSALGIFVIFFWTYASLVSVLWFDLYGDYSIGIFRLWHHYLFSLLLWFLPEII